MVNIWYQNATNYCNKWFKGSGKQPVTWETLVQTLHDSELSTVKKKSSLHWKMFHILKQAPSLQCHLF